MSQSTGSGKYQKCKKKYVTGVKTCEIPNNTIVTVGFITATLPLSCSIFDVTGYRLQLNAVPLALPRGGFQICRPKCGDTCGLQHGGTIFAGPRYEISIFDGKRGENSTG